MCCKLPFGLKSSFLKNRTCQSKRVKQSAELSRRYFKRVQTIEQTSDFQQKIFSFQMLLYVVKKFRSVKYNTYLLSCLHLLNNWQLNEKTFTSILNMRHITVWNFAFSLHLTIYG